MKEYDYKPRFQIQFQLGADKRYLIHILRFEWTEGSVIEGEITSHKSKTYKASLSSYKRVAELVNRLSQERMGKIKVWTTWPGWEYSSFGKEIENVDSHR